MAEKLKSILRIIPWSLIFKTVVFGISFLLFPFWFFFAVAICLYLIPFFQPSKLFWPFILNIFLAYFLPQGNWKVFVLSIIFFLTLGIKDLLFIKRRAAYQLLVFILLFFVFLNFFFHFKNWQSPLAFFWAMSNGLALFFLLKSFIKYAIPSEMKEIGRRKEYSIALAIPSFLAWQLSAILLFLPFGFISQTAVLCLSAFIIIDLIIDYLNNSLSRQKILFNFTIFFIVIVIILTGNNWGL